MRQGLILTFCPLKWMWRPTRQKGFLKKGLPIRWNQTSPLKAVPQWFQTTALRPAESHWDSQASASVPQRFFSNVTNLPKISPEFHVCNSWNYTVLVWGGGVGFLFLKTHVSFCLTVSLGTKYPVHLPIRLARITCFYCSYKLMQGTYN